MRKFLIATALLLSVPLLTPIGAQLPNTFPPTKLPNGATIGGITGNQTNNKLCVQSPCSEYAALAEFGYYSGGGNGTYVTSTTPAFSVGIGMYPVFNFATTASSTFGLDLEPTLISNTVNQNFYASIFSAPRFISSGRTLPDIVGFYAGDAPVQGGIVTRQAGVWVDDLTTATTNVGVRVQQNGATNFAILTDGDAPSRFNAIQGQYVSRGTAPTVANVGANSCGTTAATINATSTSNAGEITVGATSGTQCRLTFAAAAPNAWACSATNNTTAALARGVRVDTTHADLMGAFVAGDVISYQCTPR